MSKIVVKARALLHADLRAIIAHAQKSHSLAVLEDYWDQVEWMLGKLMFLADRDEKIIVNHTTAVTQTLLENTQHIKTNQSTTLPPLNIPVFTADVDSKTAHDEWHDLDQDARIYKVLWNKLFWRFEIALQIIDTLKAVKLSDDASHIIEDLLQLDSVKETESWWLDEWIVTTTVVQAFNRQFEIDLREMINTVGKPADESAT